jgi:prepilin-type N-terminal cleavage/methylation domain-containing protein
MISPRHSQKAACPRESAFTLIEIVVALTIIAVITAVAIPTISGLSRDEKAREPIRELEEMVQEARQHAMREGETYQIVFEREGIHASPGMFPYERRDEFLKQLEELRTPPKTNAIERVATERTEVQREEMVNRPEQAAPTAEKPEAPGPYKFKMPWTVSIPIPAGTECEVLMWGDGEWDLIQGEEMRRWVFQPSGMANPARVRLRSETLELEARFDALTGEPTGERAIPPKKER